MTLEILVSHAFVPNYYFLAYLRGHKIKPWRAMRLIGKLFNNNHYLGLNWSFFKRPTQWVHHGACGTDFEKSYFRVFW